MDKRSSVSHIYRNNSADTFQFPLYMDSNNTNTTHSNPTRDEGLARLEISIQSTIFFLAVFGNATVVCVLCSCRKKLKRMDLLIMHLSLADLFVAFFNILPQLIWDITFRFQGNDFLCRSVKYLQVVAMYASSYVLVTTAIDRYLAICYPLKAYTCSLFRVHIIVAMAWGLSFTFAIPQTIIFAYRVVAPGIQDCWAIFDPFWTLQLYVTWFFLAVYVIPSCILCFLYGHMCITVWKSAVGKENHSSRQNGQPHRRYVYYHSTIRKTENGNLIRHSIHRRTPPGTLDIQIRDSRCKEHVKKLSRTKLKTVKLTLSVVGCYLICWSPFFIAQMWSAWDPRAPFQGMIYHLFMLFNSLKDCRWGRKGRNRWVSSHKHLSIHNI